MSKLAMTAIAAVAMATTGLAAPVRSAPAEARAAPGHAALVGLFREWRGFVQPGLRDGVPDYSPAAMARQAAALPRWRARLAAIDPAGWSAAERNDRRLIGAVDLLDVSASFSMEVIKSTTELPLDSV